jgi:hypothetical protein
MPSGKWPTRGMVVCFVLGPLIAGCGGGTKEIMVDPDQQGIIEFAAMYRGFAQKNKRGPKNFKELQVKGQGYPNAVQMLTTGELVVRWGTPLRPEGEAGDAVLAYAKAVPEKGGNVLMQDGRTIKNMTADKFKSAMADVP